MLWPAGSRSTAAPWRACERRVQCLISATSAVLSYVERNREMGLAHARRSEQDDDAFLLDNPQRGADTLGASTVERSVVRSVNSPHRFGRLWDARQEWPGIEHQRLALDPTLPDVTWCAQSASTPSRVTSVERISTLFRPLVEPRTCMPSIERSGMIVEVASSV